MRCKIGFVMLGLPSEIDGFAILLGIYFLVFPIRIL